MLAASNSVSHEVRFPIRVRGWLLAISPFLWLPLYALDDRGSLTVILGVVVGFFFALELKTYARERSIVAAPETVVGEVAISESKPSKYKVGYRFTARDGREYTGTSNAFGGHKLALDGQKLMIVYRQDQPWQSCPASDFSFYQTIQN
ncbi:DUF3592 domain-containing protein [Candidatus Korobacter versatilis]|uniref:DUF3592 domain-containing protein n=1 Tax=Candidatus Korobacter versatilis TaxID=658062 RepID=UPI0003214377|nr:DUF3592 domain-containing protein [Candidatus Koribacter versatilis]